MNPEGRRGAEQASEQVSRTCGKVDNGAGNAESHHEIRIPEVKNTGPWVAVTQREGKREEGKEQTPGWGREGEREGSGEG